METQRKVVSVWYMQGGVHFTKSWMVMSKLVTSLVLAPPEGSHQAPLQCPVCDDKTIPFLLTFERVHDRQLLNTESTSGGLYLRWLLQFYSRTILQGVSLLVLQ